MEEDDSFRRLSSFFVVAPMQWIPWPYDVSSTDAL